MSPVSGLLGVLLLASAARGFGILPGNSRSHQEITEEAILNVTVQVCRALAEAEGNDFALPSQPFTASGVAAACRAEGSVKSFRRAIGSITLRNVRVDLLEALNASFHFDDETFVSGRDIITEGLQTVKADNKRQNFEAAQDSLGETLHTLQDFYSHSNWAENGNALPNSNLIRPDASIGNLADESRATCRSCDGDDCRNNILEDIAREQILTTGYFAVIPGTASKPTGKCSHGGALDLTSRIEPTGGINKDTFESEHGFLHAEAAALATMATSEILEDVRRAAGNQPFLQMLGISRGSGKALCFVIDTTQSMSDDIAAVRSAASSLIDGQAGTDDEPSAYILVPFNDPTFGPPIRTSDPEAFENFLDDLTASGGGDDEEPSLSGLQLALTDAPRSSDIFLFTDAPAKDRQLRSTVIALIERTQSAVYFLITQTTANGRRRRRQNRPQAPGRIAESDARLYEELAEAAGGLVVELRQDELQEAVGIIGQMSRSSLVTLARGSGTPGDDGDFTFVVDQTVGDLQLLLTGPSSLITVTDPQGGRQEFNAMSLRPVGNLQTLRLRPQVGRWRVAVQSPNAYALKAVGQSPIDFLFDFVEYVPSQNTFDVLDTRPRAGANGSLLVTLTDADAANVTRVVLAEVAGSAEVPGDVEALGRGRYLVRVPSVPSAPFVVRVEGNAPDAAGEASPFQRESATSFRASNITIKAQAARNLVPGTPLSVPFSVTVRGTGGNVSIRATTNNPLYAADAPGSLPAEPGASANGTVALSVPLNTPSGTTVTLVIEAEGPGGGGDVNYVVLRISVLNPVSDFAPPACELLCVVRCVRNCRAAPWHLLVMVSDGAEGTGVERVSLARGNGTLYVRPAPDNRNVTLATYDALCGSPDVELLVVDNVGNADTCSFNAFTASGGGRAAFFLSWAALAPQLGRARPGAWSPAEFGPVLKSRRETLGSCGRGFRSAKVRPFLEIFPLGGSVR
ncbi:von Willebrand factor A domain-containing protein 7-like isoform X1 [Hippocampus comes]|uniref:von Willebrand factor A domain-containing protein 7-like isoform X1 n=1 Tax=Hippocampus comes TaxID=109280 RepID=UPI00094EDDE9|nr:PREDICTED: von Willebrand factor A domain-containing protein 7-like isoform X1 [Hippocampus comes]